MNKVAGGVLLIGGSCLGVGMLALPISCGLAGFFPTLLLTFLSFGFMSATALYLVEVGSWFDSSANLSTQIGKILGKFWQSLAWMIYLFLFYSLLVAYISASGIHLASMLKALAAVDIPAWVGSCLFVAVFGWIVYLGTAQVDYVNRYLMAGKIVAFAFLIALGVCHVQTNNLLTHRPSYMLDALPVLVIAFGFHNMIPALNHYMHGNKKDVKKAIVGGAFFTFIVYVIWQVVAIGILPLDGQNGISESYRLGLDAAQAIKRYVDMPLIGLAGQALAFFAILTSFLAQTLSLTHYLADGLKKSHSRHIGLCLFVLLPPLAFAVSYPNIFYHALNFAGGVCAVLLFGLIPAMMMYQGYQRDQPLHWKKKISIIAVMVFALFILGHQILNLLKL
jgi:tyrosine-specific transport protein